jgi:restriction endonuclease S subunit
MTIDALAATKVRGGEKLDDEAGREPGVAAQVDRRKLLESLGVVAKAAGGIKGLRDVILDLAVKGALVPQIEGEGTGEALAARLEPLRQKLSATVRSDLPPVGDQERPYSIPSSWWWVRLGHFGGLLGGGTPPKSKASLWNGPIPWVSPKDMKRPYISDSEDHLSEAAIEESPVKLIPIRSLLFVVRGMILAHSLPVALTTEQVTINQDMKALVLALAETGEYLLRACWAARSRALRRVERSSHGTCRLAVEALEELPIALPPLGEQKRIVAKVDELMRLLDDLEVRQTKQRQTQTRLRSAALDALTSANGPQQLATAWKRVAGNFEVLLERADCVEEIRGTIEALLFSGRLRVATPARALTIDELIAARRRLFEVECKGQRYREPLRQRDSYPRLPVGWCAASVDMICPILVDSPHRTPTYSQGTEYIALRPRDVAGGRLELDTAARVSRLEYERQTARRVPRVGDIVYSRELSFGWATLVPEGALVCLSQGMVSMRPSDVVRAAYLAALLNSPIGRSQAEGAALGAAHPHVNLREIKRFTFPIPPLDVQDMLLRLHLHLMGLCEDLEGKLRRGEERAAKLVEAVVREVTAA